MGLSQASFCAEDSSLDLFGRRDSSRRLKSRDKENSQKRSVKELDSPSRLMVFSTRVLQPVNTKRSIVQDLNDDNPEDLKVPTASEPNVNIDAFSSKKRVRDESSSSPIGSDTCEEWEPSSLAFIIGEKSALEVQLLNAALYSADVTGEGDDLRHLTPQKVLSFRNAGGQTPDLREKLKVLKKIHPKHIKDTGAFPRDDEKLFSPSVRNLPREVVANLRSNGLVLHLPDYSTREPIVAETEEERAGRKERQRKEFESLELQAGRIPELLTTEREIALQPWVPYFKYIDMRQKQYEDKQGHILRWGDLVGAFLKYVAPHMVYLEIEGYDVYFSLKTLNFERKNWKDQKENHILMKNGKCPYDLNGSIMNWHHVTRMDVHSHGIKIDEATKRSCEGPYKLVLIPAFIHTEYDAFLHPQHYVESNKELNRAAFGSSREIINQKVRELFYEKK